MDHHGSGALDQATTRHPWEAHYPPDVSWRQDVAPGTLPDLWPRG